MMPEDFFKKNIEMWEKFTSNYMDTIFKTVEKSLEQSQAFKGQVEKTVNETISGQMNVTLETLQALQRQVEALSEKVDELMEKQSAS